VLEVAADGDDAEVDAELDDELDDGLEDEHPPISAPITMTVTAPAAIRARPSLDMVLTRSFREKGTASRSTLIFARLSAEQNVAADSRPDQER